MLEGHKFNPNTARASARSEAVTYDSEIAGAVQPWRVPEAAVPELPDYMKQTYYWAYVSPRDVPLLDRDLVVSVILWGQHLRLQRAAFSEVKPGQRVLQPASVYGSFAPNLARHIGPEGRLEIIDITPIQVQRCREKLRALPQASVRLADARNPGSGRYDVVCCYFLMHELPEDYKRQVTDAMLARLAPGGKLVFVDYHKPHWAHPLKPITSLVFDTLEPFAKSLWRHELRDFATDADAFTWRKETYFGGLFQKVVAARKPSS
ncbi:MAG: rhodoquinone biosynthesis methyltransferase RquA [Paracoccaceae bacterium]